MASHDWDAIEKDKIVKKQLVIDTIVSHCNMSSPHEDLRDIGNALKSGDVLIADILTGGLTNFSYKVYLSKSPETAVFAKLSFPFALWNPDPTVFHDIKRTETEFKLMKLLSDMEEDCVPTPYFCVKIENMMLIVTEYCTGSDEQWGNQFIDGVVDTRIAPKLGKAIAKLHCRTDFDRDFNDNIRPCVIPMYDTMKDSVFHLIDSSDTQSRANILAKEIGKKGWGEIVERNRNNYTSDRDVLTHGDLHVFNILVENKPPLESPNSFGPCGSFKLCDLEMSLVGPSGHDLGIFSGFPAACAVAHAINGNLDASDNMMDFLEMLWDEYAAVLNQEKNVEPEDLCDIFRNVVGFTGWYILVVCFILGAHNNYFPIEETNTKDQEKLRDSLGVLGIKYLCCGFGDEFRDSNLDELRLYFRNEVEQEIKLVSAKKLPRIERRSSALRKTGRRVSDAPLYCTAHTLKLLGYGMLEDF